MGRERKFDLRCNSGSVNTAWTLQRDGKAQSSPSRNTYAVSRLLVQTAKDRHSDLSAGESFVHGGSGRIAW
jgi:hypothetical protein